MSHGTELIVGGPGGSSVQYTNSITAPTSPNVGDYREDTDAVIRVRDGTGWKELEDPSRYVDYTQQTTAPVDPNIGDYWEDDNGVVYLWNGASWGLIEDPNSGGGTGIFNAGSRYITLGFATTDPATVTYAHGLGFTPSKISGFCKARVGSTPSHQAFYSASGGIGGPYSGVNFKFNTASTVLNVGRATRGLLSSSYDSNDGGSDFSEIQRGAGFTGYYTVTADNTNVYFNKVASLNGGNSSGIYSVRFYFDLE